MHVYSCVDTSVNRFQHVIVEKNVLPKCYNKNKKSQTK